MNEKLKFVKHVKDNSVQLLDLDAIEMHDQPLPGFYKIEWIPQMFGRKPVITMVDIQIPTSIDTTVDLVIDTKEIHNMFSEKRTRVTNMLGMNNKVGYLFHGKQGSGKTTTMLGIGKYFVENNNALVFLVSDKSDLEVATNFCKELLKLNPHLVPVFIHDECEEDFEDNEEFYKQFLDGAESPSNMIYLAATNYFQTIPETISKRPSRFKHVIEINAMDSRAQVEKLLVSMNELLAPQDALSEDAIKELSKAGTKKTVDELKHMFLTRVLDSTCDTKKSLLSRVIPN